MSFVELSREGALWLSPISFFSFGLYRCQVIMLYVVHKAESVLDQVNAPLNVYTFIRTCLLIQTSLRCASYVSASIPGGKI